LFCAVPDRSASEAAPAELTTTAAEAVEPVEPIKAVEVELAEAPEAAPKAAAEAGVLSPVESSVEIARSDAGEILAGLSCSSRHADAGEGGQDRDREYESFSLRACSGTY
jgi:hypothetical protein